MLLVTQQDIVEIDMKVQIRSCAMTQEIFAVIGKEGNDYRCVFLDYSGCVENISKDFILRRTRPVNKTNAIILSKILTDMDYDDIELVKDLRHIK